MNFCRKTVVMIGCLGVMLGTVGCASKDVVKKDEPIGKETATKPASTTPVANKATPDAKKEELKKPAVDSRLTSATPSSAQQQAKSTASLAKFDKIYFDFDSSDLSKSSRDILSRSAEILMKDQKDAIVRIEGNCDERGSAEYNMALGERRAKTAAKYLTALGVQAERLFVLSYGKEKPAVQGSNEAAWSKNRRDEFVVQK